MLLCKLMLMKKVIKRLIRKILHFYHRGKHENFYYRVMKLNNIVNKVVPGEKEWILRWSQFGVKASPTQYRVFSQYIGNDIDIVPEDICHDFIEPVLNPYSYIGYYADKNTFDKLFPLGYFPKTLLRKIGGFYYDNAYNYLNLTDDILKEKLSSAGKVRCIIKPSVEGMSGRGVQMFYKNSQGEWEDTEHNEINISYIEKHFGKDFIIQEVMEQSEYISQFNATSINTLRISLYRSVKDNQCHVTGAIMRIGGKGSIVDNAHAGGCYVGINPDGSFCHEVLDQYGQKRKVFNGVNFENDFKYPNWNQVLEFARSVGRYIPHHRLLALDIVLQKDNTPRLIEFNLLYYSSWLFQYTTGSAFGKYTDEILDYCREMQNNNDYFIKV